MTWRQRLHLAVLLVTIAELVFVAFLAAQQPNRSIELATAVNTQQINDLTRRVGMLEGLNLDRRIAILEAVQETNRMILVGIAIGIAVQLFETVTRVLRGRIVRDVHHRTRSNE